MIAAFKPTLTVVTATYNASTFIDNLIVSLQNQTDMDFVWLVQDGGSTDDTLTKVQNSRLAVEVSCEKDFSIYDALNRAVARTHSDYYLVMGADDTLEIDAIEKYRMAAAQTGADFIAAAVTTAGKTMLPQKGKGWLFGMCGEASSHSVGLLIKTVAHQRFGWYSKSFPIVADQFFVKKALASGATITRCNFVAGHYAETGFSGTSVIQFQFEFAAMQMRTESNKLLQLSIFILRIIKNIAFILKGH